MAGDSLRIALLWGRWTPYHHARLRGLRTAAGPTARILPIQYCRGSRDYAWMHQMEEPGLVTLRHARDETRFSPRAVLLSLLPLLIREQPDVLFVPSYWHWALAAALCGRLLGIPVVMMNESHAGTVRPGHRRERIRAMILRLYDAALVGGAPHVRYFAGLGVPASRIFTGYDAVDTRFFAARAEEARDNRPFTRQRLGLPDRFILWAGRMEAKKDLPTLVSAYAEFARAAGPGAPVLLIVGDGVERRNLLRHIEAESLPTGDDTGGARVVIHPFMAPADLAATYALADCVVLCSRTEEWGLVVNEAMAAGTPVVVSDTAGCVEDLLPGPTGLDYAETSVRPGGVVFGAGDATGLANALSLIHKDDALSARLRREAPAATARCSAEAFGEAALRAARRALA